MKKKVSEKDTQQLRQLYWAMQEAQQEFQNLANEVAQKNNCDLQDKWNLTPDFKYLYKED